MKKIFSTILGLVAVMAIFLASAENPDGSCNLVWTLSCLAVVAASGWAWSKLNPDDNPLTK